MQQKKQKTTSKVKPRKVSRKKRVTKVDKSDSKLKLVHLKAIELKADGFTYPVIEQKLRDLKIKNGLKYATVGNLQAWFKSTGMLHEPYKLFMAEMKETAIDSAMAINYKYAKAAAQTMASLLASQSEKIKIKAAKDIQDRVGATNDKIVIESINANTDEKSDKNERTISILHEALGRIKADKGDSQGSV